MKRLVQQLHDSGYLQFYLFFGEMNLRYKDWAAAVPSSAGPLRSLVSLFLLGEAVPRAEALSVVGDEALVRLTSAGVLSEANGAVRSNSFYLLVHRGLAYFCQMTADPFAYVGEDSLALSHYQTPVRDSAVLDLCAGPGLQSIVSAQRGNRVTAVEQSSRACEIHRINLELNGLDGRVEIVCAAVEAFVGAGTGRFDQILFNPPLVPMPGARDGFPVAGFGGVDGLELTTTILDQYRSRLAPAGCFEFVGMTVLPKRGVHPVIRLARKYRLCGRLHTLSRHALSGANVVTEMHAASLARARRLSTMTAREELDARYRQFSHFSIFYGRLHRGTGARVPVLETVDTSTTHYGGWFS